MPRLGSRRGDFAPLVLSDATPADVALAGSAGNAALASRANHVHAHGAQTDGGLHAAATTGVAGFLSTADKTILDGLDSLGLRTAAIQFLSGSTDPTAGVAAAQPAIYFRTTAGVTTVYLKTGAADTAWTLLVTQTFAGTLTSERYIASLPGSADDPAFTAVHTGVNSGMFAETSGRWSLAANGTRTLRGSVSTVEVLNALLSHDRHIIGTGTQDTVLSATTHNLALTNVDVLSLTTSGGPQTLTSITGGTTGRKLRIFNANAPGGDAITLQDDNDTDGTAANRFVGAGGLNVAIAAGGGVQADYRADSRWHIVLPLFL